MYRALTVAREYESGGDRIAALIARSLGWKLFDSALIDEIASLAHVDPELARQYDERVDSWIHRVSRRALWHGAFDAVATLDETDVFDAETMAQLTCGVIEHAYEQGNCVIVGRGSQCLLQGRPDVFHAFLFGPPAHHSLDEARARYVKANFGCDWQDPHLYDLLLNTRCGEAAAVSTILLAMGAPS